MSFKRPSMKVAKKRDLQSVSLPDVNIYDTRFNRRENLILNILKYSCPKSTEFATFPARLTEKFPGFARNNIVCLEYDYMIEGTFKKIYSNFLVEGAKLKFKSELMLDPEAKITYESKNEYANVAYANVLSLLSRIKYNDEIESFYENWNDLLYDIYVASEYAKYMFTYLDGITQQQLLDLEKETNINLYQAIIAFFNSQRQTAGTDWLKQNLLPKDKFIDAYVNKKAESQFPLVQGEISTARKLLTLAYNMTRDAHDLYLDTLIKATIFEKFSTDIVQPQMFVEVRNEFQTNAEQAKKIYGYADKAEANMLLNLKQMIDTYKTPLVSKGDDFRVFEDVYLLFINGRLPISTDVDLLQTIRLYENLKRGQIPPREIGHFVSLSPNNLRVLGKTIKLNVNNAEPSKFKFLCPGNKDTPFESNGIIFQSIIEFATFNMLVNVLEVPAEKAVQLMSSDTFDNLTEVRKDFIRNIQKKIIIEKVDEFSKEPQARRFFEQHENSQFKALTPCVNFIQSFFLDYLTDVKELYIKNLVDIKDSALIDFILNKAGELLEVLEKVNTFSPNTVNDQSGRLNLWNSIYKYKTRDVPSRIEKISGKPLRNLEKEAIDYVTGHVLYNLTSYSQEDLGRIVNSSYFELYEDAPEELTIEDVNYAINSVVTILRTFVFNNVSSSPRTDAELRLALSIILNTNIPLEINETNFWKTISRSDNIVEFSSRIFFMKKLHEVQPQEFLGPRSEVAFEPAASRMVVESGAAADISSPTNNIVTISPGYSSEVNELKKKVVVLSENAELVIFELDGEGMQLLNACGTKVVDQLERHRKFFLYGREVQERRSVGFFSDESKGYKYSKKTVHPNPLTPELKALLEYVNRKLGSHFNGILVNYYESGDEYISKHSDDEKGLDPSAGVVALNLGASRIFRIRDKNSNKIVLDVKTNENEMLQMAGKDFQKMYTHEIPKQKGLEWRISFTFRYHDE